MAVDFLNLQGSVDIAGLSITIGVPYLNNNFKDIIIPYVGTSNPATNVAAISLAQYSLNGGTTWSDMTPTAGTSVTGLTFTTAGTSLSYGWRARNDIGGSIYNTSILIRFRVTAGGFTSAIASKTILFTRTTENLNSTQRTQDPFPVDYSGVAGWELLRNAPTG